MSWPVGEDLHRVHGETARQAKAFIAHYLRRDDEAILATAPQHLRTDPESWYFVMALVAEVGSLARVLYDGPEGAEVWAQEKIRRFHEDNPDVV